MQPSILLVEDDAFQRKAAEAYLVITTSRSSPWKRRADASADLAVDADLVLLDVQLPGQKTASRWPAGCKATPGSASSC
jgi:DNA-binding response OmpR family regulator